MGPHMGCDLENEPELLELSANNPEKKEKTEDEPEKPAAQIIVRNDYMQNFINTSLRPQNYIREVHPLVRFTEYPKLQHLAQLKDAIVDAYATPPMYIKANLRREGLGTLLGGIRFDVILIDPPLREYCEWSPSTIINCPDPVRPYWTWEEIGALAIEDVAATPSFIFIWVGDCEGLDQGRSLLRKWGYRRCEDICWVKTNKTWPGTPLMAPPSVFQHTKEHCLMGIRGTVRRSTDGHFIHCNVDTDVIIAEEPEDLTTRKPEELYYLIEHFCMGRRRLELFGNDENIRRGWITVGLGLSTTNWDRDRYLSWLRGEGAAQGTPYVRGGLLVPTTPDIEAIRPKSPPLSVRKGPRRGII
ncbi:uncharacterized protein SPPG_06562 [Spizellomyces punctatus DAOM BR117]|uniref:MT-A70-domain-containing protein n=1 Tax=Spizellomyces punctatus (strain DAOM BR117) TaxID=645134 RepID=A0A0L0HBQ2_SPIPD|nr:uncharacterized protein SPPG_06562 [Spizellomyces punctatus DAOM BR117]KNC98158.1 hypothetical protein SPPG_06562 [Spizellomyces punctatus DAOM BR117]|eukprot:XP_016606198.1 hypothetical protein SPPG_06562 [Spizellomyces punctatus DAOM BR117]